MGGSYVMLMSGILRFCELKYRGGNEKGREWHKNGCKESKINSFRDLISCGEYLIAQGYTHPSLLCAYGSSAGGLLLGNKFFHLYLQGLR